MNSPVVLHLVSGLSLMGGTSAKVYTLVKYSQYKHIIFYPHRESNQPFLSIWESLPNCTLVEGFTRKNYIKDAINVYRLLDKLHPNIIHAYFPPETIVASIVKLFHGKIKIIRSFEGNVNHNLFKRAVIKLALSNFDKLIYISKYVEDFYRKRIPASKKGNGCIIYNAAAHQKEAKNPIKHYANTKEIVTVSGLNPFKNLFTLIEAINILTKKGILVHLNILGDGILKEKLQEKINEYHINQYVSLLGYSDKVIEYLDASSIYVHPANNEGFGIAVIEAMQRYCAIIVSNAGALPEIITNNVDGLIADVDNCMDWANKIEMLLNNQDLIDKLGRNAYLTANQRFSVNKYIEEHEKLYKQLIK